MIPTRPLHKPFFLLAVALASAASLRAGAADAGLIQLLPPGAIAAGSIDVASLRASELFQSSKMMMEPQPGEGGELSEDDKMKQKAMRVFESLESLVSASYYENPDEPGEREDLFVMKGAFPAAEIKTLMADAPGEKAEHRGVVIHNVPRDLDKEAGEEAPAEPEPPISLGFLTESIAVAGSEARVRQAIDRHLDGAQASNGSLFALGAPVPQGYQLWHIVDAKPLQAMAPPADAGGEAPEGPAGMAAGMMAGLLGDMEHVRIALQLSDGVGLRLEGLFNSADKAKMAAQAFTGLLAMTQLASAGSGEEGGEASAESPVPPAALELLKSIEVLSADQSAGIGLKITGQQIGNLMFAFMDSGLGDAPPEEPAQDQ